MVKKYTSEQFWKLYENLPQELKDALFAEETGNIISEACEKNGVADNLEAVVDLVGAVLTGMLPLENFQKSLEEELKMETETAKKVSHEINRFVLYPVKTSLEGLYGKAPALSNEPPTAPTAPRMPADIAPQEQGAPQKGDDNYREPIE